MAALRAALLLLVAVQPCAAVPHPAAEDAPDAKLPAEKCAKCPARAHEAHHPPPSTEGVNVLLGKGPPPIMRYGAEAPTGGVDVASNELLRDRMETNINYLLTSFDVDHLLAPFRQRAGNASASWGARAPVRFWDGDLLGSNAGRFLMGAGTTLRWIEHPELRRMMDAVVDGVDANRNDSTGYILAYEP